MSTVDYILLVLLSLPPKYGDGETVDQRTRRMQVVASAIDAVTARATCSSPYDKDGCKRVWIGSRKDLALLLVTKAWWESRLARNVHENDCADWECDATRTRSGNIVHRARSMWQLQKTGMISNGDWEEMAAGIGYRSTRTAAWNAARILSLGRHSCGSIYGAFSYYARNYCKWKGANSRYAYFVRLKKKSASALRSSAKHYLVSKDRRTQHFSYTSSR